MAVADKTVGAVSQVTAASNPVPTPAVVAGDLLVLTIVSLGSSVTLPAGWAEITPPFDLDGAYMHTWWKYADASASATTTTVSAPGAASAGWVATFSGAKNTAPARQTTINTAPYADSPALTGAGFRMVAGIVWANRAAAASTAEGSITATPTTHLWELWSGFRLGMLTANVTAASGGTLRFNWSGATSTDSSLYSLLIEEEGDDPEPPEPTHTIGYYDGTTETTLDDATIRYWDGATEHGFWYGHTLSYWDGTDEL